MNNKARRFLALFLSVVMVLSLLNGFVLPAKEAHAAPTTLNGYTDFSDKLVSHEIIVDGKKINSGDTINPSESFSLKLNFKIGDITDMAEGGLKYFLKLPEHISIGNQGSVDNQKTLYNSKHDAIGSYYILDDVIYIEFPGYYDGVNAFFEMEASWEDTEGRSKVSIPWPDVTDEYMIDFSDLAVVKNQSGYVNQDDGSLKNNFNIIIRGKRDDVAIDNIKFEDVYNHTDNVKILKDAYGSGADIKVSYYDKTNALISSETYKLSDVGDDEGFIINGLSLVSGGYIKIEYCGVMAYDKRIELDGKQKSDSYNNVANASYDYDNPVTGDVETLSSKSEVRGTYEGGTDWIMKDAGDVTKIKQDKPGKTIVPYTVNVNRHRFYSLGGSAVHDEITGYVGGDVVYDTSKNPTDSRVEPTSYVDRVVDSNNNPNGERILQEWVILDDETYAALQDLCQNASAKTEYEEINDDATLKAKLISAIKTQQDSSVSDFDEDTALKYIFTDAGNHNFVWITPPDSEPTTYIIHYNTLADTDIDTFKNGASLWYTEYDVTYPDPGNGWHRPVKKVLNSSKTNFGVYIGDDGNYYVDYKVTVGLEAGSAGFDGIAIVDEFANHNVNINGKDYKVYDFLSGFNADDVDLANLTGEENRQLVTPCFEITTDSDNPKVQDVCNNAYAMFYHNVNGDISADDFYDGYDAYAELLLRDYNSTTYHGDAVEAGQFILYSDVYNYDRSYLIAKKGETVAPKSTIVWLGDLPAAEESKGYNIILRYTMQINPVLIEKLPELLEQSIDTYVSNENVAHVYEKYWYNGRYIVNFRGSGHIQSSASSYWLGINDDHPGLVKNLDGLASDNSKASYNVTIDPDESIDAKDATSVISAKYEIEDVLNVPGLKYIKNSFVIKDKDGKVVWTNKSGVSVDASYSSYEDSINLELTNEDSASNRYKILLDNKDGKFTDANGKLMKLTISYDIDTSVISTEETIINNSTLAELVKDIDSEPEKKSVLGEDSVEFAIDKALEKKLSNKANASNDFVSSYYVDVNPNSENAKELKDINVGDKITIEDTLSDTLEVIPGSVKVYQYKGRDFVNETEITNSSEIAYHTNDNNLVVTLTVEDKDCRYRVTYDAKVLGGSNEYVKCINTAKVRGTTVTLDQTIDKVLIHDYREGSEAVVNQVKIEKFDEYDTRKHLNATFDLYKGTVVNNQVTWELLTDEAVTGYGPIKTGDDGIILVKNKVENSSAIKIVDDKTWYKLVETDAPEDYMLREEPIYYYVSSDGEDADGLSIPEGIDKYVLARMTPEDLNGDKAPVIRVSNQKFGFDVNKVLKGTSRNLKGAEFAAYSDANCTSLIQKVKDGEGQYDLNEDGIIEFRNIDISLDSDVIYLKETKAPEGCVLDRNVYEIRISNGYVSKVSDEDGNSFTYSGQSISTDGCGQLVKIDGEKELPTFEIYNEESKGRLVVKKTVEQASEETLEKSFNFGITIKDEDGKESVDSYEAIKTDSEGKETVSTYVSNQIISLKNGEQFEIVGIPDGFTYEVKEVVDNAFETSINQSDSNGNDNKTVGGNVVSGNIDESGIDTVEYVNKGTIELDLTKTCVDGDGNEIDIPNGFTFELKSGSDSYFKITWDAVSKKFKLQEEFPGITFKNTDNGVVIGGIPLYRNRLYYLSESGADISGLACELSYTINGYKNTVLNNNTISFYPTSRKNSAASEYPVDNHVVIKAVNKYDNKFTETNFEAEKEYNKTLKGNEFAFDLYQIGSMYGSFDDAKAVLLQTVFAKADGKVSFDNVKFVRTGTYYFGIKERVPEDVDRRNRKDGITYDNSFKRIKVVVKRTSSGDLDASDVTYVDENLKFVNKYEANGDITLEGTKSYNKAQDRDAFKFKLTEYTDNTYATVKKDSMGADIVRTTGNTSQTLANANSTFEFDLDFSYDAGDVGKHYYIINEIDPNENDGITYDDREIKVVVTVSDNNDGTLNVTKEVSGASGIHFDNTYDANGKIAFAGTKTLVNHNIADNQFEFVITEYTDDTYATPKMDSSNKNITYTAGVESANFSDTSKSAVADIKYPEISYSFDDIGSHYYIIEEKIPSGATNNSYEGITYDSTKNRVRVDVTDAGKGKLNVNANYVSGDANFTNTYNATGKLVLSGKKILNGRNIKDNEFLIYGTRKDVSAGTTSDTSIYGRVNSDGTISFDEITYDENDIGKTYEYTLYENEPNVNPGGITYSSEEYKVTVKISDGNNGSLSISKTIVDKAGKSVDSIDFINEYDAKASISFTAKKALKGRELADGQFTFDIYEGDELVSSGSNDANGNIAFDEIEYYIDGSQTGVKQNIGTHNYIVKERVPNPKPEGYTYSNKTYEVSVNVTDNGDGTLKVVVSGASIKDGSVSYEITKNDEDEATFINSYEASGKLLLEGKKTLIGRSLDDKEFKFEVTEYKVSSNAAGEEVLNLTGRTYTAYSDAKGKINFDNIEYIKNSTKNDEGLYKYVVKEVVPDVKAGGVTYDDTIYEVYANVEDADGGKLNVTSTSRSGEINFTNTYEASGTLTIKAKKMAMMFDSKKVYDDVNSDGKNMGNVFTFEVYEMLDKNSANATGGVADSDDRFVNKLVSEGSCKVSEEVDLSDIVYSLSDVGNHVYKVVEKAGNAKGYVYDKTEYYIFVGIEDGRKGTLIVTVEEDTKEEVVNKLLGNTSGYSRNSVEYGVNADDNEGVNDPNDPSLISSGARVFVDGKANYEAEFVNTYKAEVNLELKGEKEVENLSLNNFKNNIMKDGAFRFSFKEFDKSGKEIKSKEEIFGKSLSDGSILFDAIHYTLQDVGTHYYQITEDIDNQINNVLYTAKPVCAKVVVKNEGDGNLSTEVSYARNADIKDFISNNESGKLEKAEFVNKLTEVKIKKITEDGSGLAGAKMAILNKKGKVVFRFTSEVKETVCYGLLKDVEYTLHEVKAPKGYELADDINFKIDEKGNVHIFNEKKSKKVETVKMTDKKSVNSKKSKDKADGDNDEDDDDDNPEDTLDAHRHKRDNDKDENNESRTVETGDNSRIALMLVIFIMSGSANAYLLRSKRRNKKSIKK